MARSTWLDRAVGYLAPQTALRRVRARVATDLLLRHYEGAATGRRTQGWKRTSGDASAVTGPYVGRLRDVARDLVRNNPYAESALSTIVDHAIGWGIVAKASTARAQAVWDAWAGTTACDADGRHDFYGLQKLVFRTVVESGEVLVRRRFRRPEDNLPIPLQLQVLEPDFLDTSKHGVTLAGGGRIVYGVEFNGIGQRVAYWLFREHPGNSAWPSTSSERVPADGVIHMFKGARPGLARGASWFSPVLLRFKDFDELEDAVLMKQKIAACLAVITSDVDGSASALGTVDSEDATIDQLQPGAILNVPPGRNVEVVRPPQVDEYPQYAETVLRAIATGLGVTYEDLTGDYTDLPFSAARMSRLRHWARVEDWRWRLIAPQFLDPVWRWAMTAAEIMGTAQATARWTAPPMPMLEPDKEGLALLRLMRIGALTWPEMQRERGGDPDVVLAEIAETNKKLDELGIVLDMDPRKITQAGQQQAEPGQPSEPTAESEKSDAAARLFGDWVARLPDHQVTGLFQRLFGERR